MRSDSERFYSGEPPDLECEWLNPLYDPNDEDDEPFLRDALPSWMADDCTSGVGWPD